MIIEFETSNAAFDEDCGGNKRLEINRVLKDIQDRILAGCTAGTIIDINGNKIGYWRL